MTPSKGSGGGTPLGVGPVLIAGEQTERLIEALRSDNAQLRVEDRGAYWRVTAPEVCVLSRARAEAALGRTFRLPGDLEPLMPAFVGELTVTTDSVSWRAKG